MVLVEYQEADSAGLPTGFVADDPVDGISYYRMNSLVSVLEQADRDLWDWDYGPGLDEPQLRALRSR